MITEVLEPKKEDCLLTDTFENDWKKAISGEEFVRRVHKHIDEWWDANRNGNCNS